MLMKFFKHKLHKLHQHHTLSKNLLRPSGVNCALNIVQVLEKGEQLGVCELDLFACHHEEMSVTLSIQ